MRRRQNDPRCSCGRGEKVKGQRYCKQCHAEDMRERRRQARDRGTYTIKGTHVPRATSRETDSAADREKSGK
jgi:hypothetical protein